MAVIVPPGTVNDVSGKLAANEWQVDLVAFARQRFS